MYVCILVDLLGFLIKHDYGFVGKFKFLLILQHTFRLLHANSKCISFQRIVVVYGKFSTLLSLRKSLSSDKNFNDEEKNEMK